MAPFLVKKALLKRRKSGKIREISRFGYCPQTPEQQLRDFGRISILSTTYTGSAGKLVLPISFKCDEIVMERSEITASYRQTAGFLIWSVSNAPDSPTGSPTPTSLSDAPRRGPLLSSAPPRRAEWGSPSSPVPPPSRRPRGSLSRPRSRSPRGPGRSPGRGPRTRNLANGRSAEACRRPS